MYPSAYPTSQIGQLQTEIQNLKSELRRKVDDYKIETVNNKLDTLEHSYRELRAEIDGLLFRMQTLEQESTD